jgi:hypothetical protein
MRLRFVLIVGMALAMVVSANGFIDSGDRVLIDLTDPNSVGEHGLVWTPEKKVQQTDKGLVFSDSMNNASVDFGMLTKAYPVGLSWRPIQGVRLGVDLSPVGKETKYSGGILQPTYYMVYVRYSMDMKNWSSWHAMQNQHLDMKARKKAGKHQFKIQLQVPQIERKEYTEYLYKYMKMDVPWTSDEEALAKWILTKEPDFFKKHTPFIGYIQFLCEGGMRANQPLSKMKIDIGWGVGGTHSPPRDEDVYKNRDNVPWRFKASDKKLSPLQKKMTK